jgi:hypothetical protein
MYRFIDLYIQEKIILYQSIVKKIEMEIEIKTVITNNNRKKKGVQKGRKMSITFFSQKYSPPIVVLLFYSNTGIIFSFFVTL